MAGKLMLLLRAQYRNQSSLNALRYETNPKKRLRTMGIYAAMMLVAVIMSGYSFLFAYGYGYLGMAEVIPGFALMLTSIVALMFTFMKTNGILFAFRDYDMLMALPVSTKTVISSRFLYMYINNLIFGLCVMLPMCVGYAVWVHPGIVTYLIWLIAAAIAPLLPMTIASAAGALIAAIGSRFRFKVFVQAVLSMLLVLAIFGVSFLFQGTSSSADFLNEMENLGTMLQTQLHKIYPMTVLFDRAVNESDAAAFVGFLVISVVIYLLFTALVSVKYKAINTALMTGSSRSHYKLGRLETHTMLHALVVKEGKRFTSSITYLMNIGMGMFLAVIASIACAVIGLDRMLAGMNIEGFSSVKESAIYAAPFVIAAMLTMTCTTSVSLSLEGKNLWIVKSLPIGEHILYQSKMAFNLVLLIPAAVICNLCLAFALKLRLLMFVLYLFILLGAVLFSTAFGMWAGKKFANFEWENEIEVIKQGAGSMVGIIGNMLLEILLTVAAVALSRVIDGRLGMVLLAALLYLLSGLCYRSVMKSTKD